MMITWKALMRKIHLLWRIATGGSKWRKAENANQHTLTADSKFQFYAIKSEVGRGRARGRMKYYTVINHLLTKKRFPCEFVKFRVRSVTLKRFPRIAHLVLCVLTWITTRKTCVLTCKREERGEKIVINIMSIRLIVPCAGGGGRLGVAGDNAAINGVVGGERRDASRGLITVGVATRARRSG